MPRPVIASTDGQRYGCTGRACAPEGAAGICEGAVAEEHLAVLRCGLRIPAQIPRQAEELS